MTGNWVQLFGLDPSEKHIVKAGEPLDIRIPFKGHDYVAVQSNLVTSQYCSMNGESLKTAELLSIVPTPGLPGDIETYFAYTTGGKCELDNTHVDSITLEFTDKDGNHLRSLKEFVLVLVIDTIVPTPIPKNEDGHVSLFEARNATMNQLRKKLRTEM